MGKAIHTSYGQRFVGKQRKFERSGCVGEKVFLDTPAFAKRYVAEQGTDKITALCQQADSLVVSVICLPELISTLSRLVREKRLSKADWRKLKGDTVADRAIQTASNPAE